MVTVKTRNNREGKDIFIQTGLGNFGVRVVETKEELRVEMGKHLDLEGEGKKVLKVWAMERRPLSSSLRRAKICLDCDTLFEEGEECPLCLNGKIVWVAKWILPTLDGVREGIEKSLRVRRK